ncbi:U4/U6.U5 small nuclear ribonucleoprotein 27 kDa protein isoform X1 [Diachasma alloeum]|uniref:Transformer male isoform n=1 Tax=Diachasma alloeum TaxID=454923 RepID=A0A4E0RNQ3_9HYME|nr:U4/U6.U5 small nuclear ribonucleoprotein 27 kDa protein isoform X1 [Diachasma alloeum]THK33056.1 transformer male isoform [Diachasma alloeum]
MRRSDDRSREYRDSRDYLPEDRLRELERKRREWRIEQEKRREHEKRKQKMIQEWEAKRARELEGKNQRRRSKSRSRSASPGPSRRRGRSRSVEKNSTRASTKVPVMSERFDSASSSNTPLFKGMEGSKISVSELKKIKVNIQRDISKAEETSELLRDITSPDEIVLKRREGKRSLIVFLSIRRLITVWGI